MVGQIWVDLEMISYSGSWIRIQIQIESNMNLNVQE